MTADGIGLLIAIGILVLGAAGLAYSICLYYRIPRKWR